MEHHFFINFLLLFMLCLYVNTCIKKRGDWTWSIIRLCYSLPYTIWTFVSTWVYFSEIIMIWRQVLITLLLMTAFIFEMAQWIMETFGHIIQSSWISMYLSNMNLTSFFKTPSLSLFEDEGKHTISSLSAGRPRYLKEEKHINYVKDRWKRVKFIRTCGL